MMGMDAFVLLLNSFLTGRSAMTKVVPKNSKRKTVKEVLTETGKTRQQFEKDFLPFLKEQTAELAKKPSKSEVLESLLAICNHLKKGNWMIESNPELSEAVKEFEELYHPLYTSLDEAVHAETTDALKILIRNNVDVKQRYNIKNWLANVNVKTLETTALNEAVSYQKEEHVKILLKLGADPFECFKRYIISVDDDYKGTPIDSAIACGELSMLKVLLECGVDINHEHKYEAGETYFTHLLRWASSSDRNELPDGREKFLAKIKLMLDYNANVNHVSPDRTTPLMHAAVLGDEGLVKKFLDKQASQTIENVDDKGRNVLCYASSVDVARLLLASGARLNEEIFETYKKMPWNNSRVVDMYRNWIIVQRQKSTFVSKVVQPNKQNEVSGPMVMFSNNVKQKVDTPNFLLEFMKLSRADLRRGK